MRAYKANMIPGGVTPTINVSQYDNDYAVTVTLIEGAEIYTPPVGATIRVEGTKPDGHGFEYPCTYQGNVVTMPIYTQMTAVAGRFPIELVVYQSGLRVGSCNIVFAVEKAPLGEDTDISETVIPDIIAGAQAQAEAAAASAASAETAAQELQSLLIHETASGAVASFADGANNLHVDSLVAEITPVQSGTGDPSPSNIRPISGRTGLTLKRGGKNLLNPALSYGLLSIVVGGSEDAITTSRRYGYTERFPSLETITLSIKSSDISMCDYAKIVQYVDGIAVAVSNNAIMSDTTTTQTLTMQGRANSYCRLIIGSKAEKNDCGTFIQGIAQIEIGSTATEYEPYTAPTEIPISWQTEAGTVYGGTLDVVSGVLTVDRKLVVFDGTGVTWEKYTPSSGNYCFRTTISDKAVGLTPMYANSYKALTEPVWGTSDYGVFSGHATLAQVYFRPPNASVVEVADWNAWLAANNLQVVYPLATPSAVYNLTPTEVKTLLGGNTIYTDAGSVSVEYVADTKLYIDNKVAELQALILEN